MPTDAPTAFFSYSREDSEFAIRLAGDLKAAGAVVWIDQLDIEPGQAWDNAIEDAVTQCPRMLLVLSAASVKSKKVRNEIAFALDEEKTIIPVLYQDCMVPLQLRRIQHIDFRTDYARGFKALVKVLSVEQQTAASAAVATGAPVQSHPVISDAARGGVAEQARLQDPALQQKRHDLYVKLSRQQTERCQVYADEFHAELSFLTADAEAGNEHIPDTVRREIRTEANRRLTELETTRRNAVAPHEREFSETIAEVRLAFPETPEFDQLLANAVQRPTWDIRDPNCDARDVPCLQRWTTAEAKKADAAIGESRQRVAALLRYMKAHKDH